MKFYFYIYYRVFDLVSLTGNWGDGISESIGLLSFLEGIGLNQLLLKYTEIQIDWWGYFALFGLLIGINYRILIKNHEDIVNRYSNELSTHKIVGRLILLFVIILIPILIIAYG